MISQKDLEDTNTYQELKILFEDAHLLVCYKPAGAPVQSAHVGSKDCENILKNYLYEKEPKRGMPYLGIIHRLDQPVEGLLVFAKTGAAAKSLSRQIQDGRMRKTYLAVRRTVDKATGKQAENTKNCGKPGENVEKSVENWTEITDYLRKNGRENRSEIVPEGTAGAKKAVLRYRTLKAVDGQELVEIQLVTGRHHQIRVQLAGLGTPLAGDQKYGEPLKTVDSVDKSYPALCAYRLEFVHPKTGKPLSFQINPKNSSFAPFG